MKKNCNNDNRKKYNNEYYLGLDIGTDSVGFAVTDKQYNLLKFHGNDAWGTTIFDAAKLKQERRGHRSDRRRLGRRKQRVKLLQEIFAKEISKVDERFFVRLEESYLWREDTTDRYTVFEDADYTDKEYHKEFPTIHHLICELMNNKEKHDVRLVYLACAWLVSHRGHFLKNIDEKNLSKIKDINVVYDDFREFFLSNEYEFPWEGADVERVGEVLKDKTGVREKKKNLIQVLLGGRKPNKETKEEFPYNEDAILQLLAGGSCKLKDIYAKKEYDEFGSVTLMMDDEKLEEIAANIGEDYDLIEVLRKLSDWAALADILDKAESISQAKIGIYEQHKNDLRVLKYFIKKYCTPTKYNEIFCKTGKDNYVKYTCHTKEVDMSDIKEKYEKASIEDFSKYILKEIKDIESGGIDDEDKVAFEDMRNRLELRTFMPKQKNTDNRVVPYQLYLFELNKILDNASTYLEFLNTVDESGCSNKEKICSIFKFKLPYFVGPLNEHSEFAWIKRINEKITPWNYTKVIDFDASEEAFIKKLTNQCTYLPGEPVVPKDSLCYHRFMVLNEINNLKIDGKKIPVSAKQGIYSELFEKKKKVRRKDIIDYLISNNYLEKGMEECVSGIDIDIKSNLSTHIAFKKLIGRGLLNEYEVEDIIQRASYAEDKSRVAKYIEREYPNVSKEDIKYITGIKVKDFGRLSRKFLTEFEGASKNTGEVMTILRALWKTNDNLMELLSDKYTFADNLVEYSKEYYTDRKKTLDNKLDDMYISNSVRRPIYRTIDIVNDVYKAFGTPKKIFIEMTRGSEPDKKGKRTTSRKQQILELFDKCNEEDVRELKRQLEELGERVDSKLQGDKLFLYFMQGGISAYSGKPIILERLLSGSKEYDIEHIYPQSYVKDDSIINNKVLVYSEENGKKDNDYPIAAEIRNKMSGIWAHWRKTGAISEEKYRRLIRSTKFTEDEKYKFINRQLTETSQSTKAAAELLKAKFPNVEIVYTKARLATDFRHEYGIYKSRSYNDLHHAVDAYLNIVTGNVYNMKFSHKWFNPNDKYSVKVKTIFNNRLVCDSEVIWNGKEMLEKVKNTALRNTAHVTKYAYCRQGKLFDQQPLRKQEGLIPLKKGLDTSKYGGYNKPSIMFFIPVRYTTGKKKEILVMPVEVMYGKRFLEDEKYARQYTEERLKNILNKTIDSFDFPLGMRPWKINTLLSFDGFEACITGSSNKGANLIVQTITQFVTDDNWKYYIKKIEKFTEKLAANQNYIYDEEYDKVSCEKNIELYDLYTDKLNNTIYAKRANSPKKLLNDNRDKFVMLDIKEQSRLLMNIQSLFGRNTSGCDLCMINGSKKSGVTTVSSSISNWKKYYSDVRIIDRSASGMWEKQSENLLELL